MKINWSKQHTKGFIIGVITTVVSCFIVVGVLGWRNGYSYSVSLSSFMKNNAYTAKVLSMASLTNLIWFHFLSIRKENWGLGKGVITATFLSLLLFVYYRFIA